MLSAIDYFGDDMIAARCCGDRRFTPQFRPLFRRCSVIGRDFRRGDADVEFRCWLRLFDGRFAGGLPRTLSAPRFLAASLCVLRTTPVIADGHDIAARPPAGHSHGVMTIIRPLLLTPSFRIASTNARYSADAELATLISAR